MRGTVPTADDKLRTKSNEYSTRIPSKVPLRYKEDPQLGQDVGSELSAKDARRKNE